MASFDIINVVGQAYRKTWIERSYLLRMAMIPFLVKLACSVALFVLFDDVSLWMTGIILLPAFFLEGWLLAHWARTVMTGTHRWPFQPTGDEGKDLKELAMRGRGVMGGMLAFVLINFLMAGYFAALFSGMPDITESFNPENPDPRIAQLGLIVIVTTLLLFRFVWVYVPLSVNIPLGKILAKLKPMKLTFRLMGVWIICVVPAIMGLQILTEILASITSQQDIGAVEQTGFILFRIALDMIKNLICTAGMAYVFLALFSEDKK